MVKIHVSLFWKDLVGVLILIQMGNLMPLKFDEYNSMPFPEGKIIKYE